MEMEDILAFKKLVASIAGNDLNNISGSTLSEVVDNCVMTVVLKDGNQASKVSYVKANDYLINPETGTFYTVAGDNFDYWQVVSADTNQESCKCYNRSFDMRITQSCSIVAVYKGQETMLTVSLKDGNSSIIQAIVSNGELLTDESNNFYQATGDNFAYWSVFASDDGKEVARCYNKSFNLRVYDNYTIVAVYNVEREPLISISKPHYTRDKVVDDSGNVTSDSLKAHFIVAYMGTDNVLLNSVDGQNYHTGIIVEYGKDVKIDNGENDDKVGSTYDGELNDFNGFTGEEIKKIATNEDKTYAHESITLKDKTYAAHKFVIDNSKYNNFNRLDYYVQFNNNKNIRHYIMKAYYYVYQTDNDGVVVENSYKVTEPVKFCYYNIGNSNTDVANTAL